MYKVYCGLLLCLALFCLTAEAQTLSTDSPDVSEQRIALDLDYLASDALTGRDSGTEGNRLAADYIRKCFESSGFQSPEPLGTTFFQMFQISGTEYSLGTDNSLSWTLAPMGKRSLDPETDFTPCSFGANGTITGPIAFCGYGISSSEAGYDDFAETDLEGKIVLIVRRVPGQGMDSDSNPFIGRNGTLKGNYAALSSKLRNAVANKAAGVIFVNDPYSLRQNSLDQKDTIDQLMPLGYGGAPGRGEIPVIHATVASIDALMIASAGYTLAALTSEIDQSLTPQSFVLPGLVATLTTQLETEQLKTNNIVAELPGTGELADETVIIGAHIDHVGMGAYGSLSGGPQAIHNGADDNASGTTGLMELARRLQNNPNLQVESRRRIVLIGFSAEERGLLGSKHYVSDPVFPLDQTIAMINMDMIGRMSDSKVTIFGFGGSDFWTPWFLNNTNGMHLNIVRKTLSLGPSDHAPFYELGIPVLHFFTGLHGDYHRPTDDSHLVNVQGIRRIVDVLVPLTIDLATTSEKPSYIENKTWINIMAYAAGTPHLGLIPELHDTDQQGVIVKGTLSDSPLAIAGVKSGDLLTHWDGEVIESHDDLLMKLGNSKPDQVVTLTLDSNGASKQVDVKLGKPR